MTQGRGGTDTGEKEGAILGEGESDPFYYTQERGSETLTLLQHNKHL